MVIYIKKAVAVAVTTVMKQATVADVVVIITTMTTIITTMTTIIMTMVTAMAVVAVVDTGIIIN